MLTSIKGVSLKMSAENMQHGGGGLMGGGMPLVAAQGPAPVGLPAAASHAGGGTDGLLPAVRRVQQQPLKSVTELLLVGMHPACAPAMSLFPNLR